MDKPSSFQKDSHNVPQQPKSVNRQAGEAGGRRHLLRAAGVMGSMTLLSRILGMMRDVVSAKAFGTTWQWDAFIYAFMLPNFFRRLVGEGALNSAFVPVYGEILQTKGKAEAFRFTNVMMTLLAVGFSVFLLVIEGVLAALLNAGWLPERLLFILDLLRFFFPYLVLTSFYALSMGVLNSHRHFFGPSIGPVLLNVLWIAGILAVSSFGPGTLDAQLRWLAVVILISGVLQVLCEIPYLLHIGLRPAWIWNTAYPGVKKTFELLLPVTLGFAVMQINLMVDMTLSFLIGPGANSSLWYGNRLMQFPLGVFAVAMGTALLPSMSRQLASGNVEAARGSLAFSLKGIFLIILPCAAGLMMLNTPIVKFLFERGEFDAESTRRTAAVLFYYSIGLVAYSGQKIITAGFYAVQDTKTPVKAAVIALITNVSMNLILMRLMAEAGLALGTALAGLLQFGLLIFWFHCKIVKLPIKEIFGAFLKIALASACMGLFALWLHGWLTTLLPGESTPSQAVRVLGTITLAAASFPLFCFLFRVSEIKSTFRLLFKRKDGGQNPKEGMPTLD